MKNNQHDTLISLIKTNKMSSFLKPFNARNCSAPCQPIQRHESKLHFTQKLKDDGKSELIVQLHFSDGTSCPRDIRVETSPDNPNYQYIKDTLMKITPVLLSDSLFNNLSVSFDTDQVIITMANDKVINITDHIDNPQLGMFIINEIMSDNKLPLNDVCPILHDQIRKLLDDGEDLVRIEGEPHIYHKETLEYALSYSGLNISPMTRLPISRLLPVVQVDNTAVPFQALAPPIITGVTINEETAADVMNEDSGEPLDVTIIVDVSYSMGQGDHGNMAYLPLKKYIESLATSSRIKIITFSNDYQVSFDLADKDQIDLNNGLKTMLAPRGGTAFRDAMIRAINEFKNNDDDRKHLMFVITDGLDYDSHKSIDDLNSVTASAWADDGKNIDCLFMHPPALNGAEALQLSPDRCLTFHPDPQYTEAAIASLRTVTQQYSCGAAPQITGMMRQSSCPARYVAPDRNDMDDI